MSQQAGIVAGIALGLTVGGVVALASGPLDCNFIPNWSPVDKLLGHDLDYAGSNPSGYVFLIDQTDPAHPIYSLRYECN